MRAWFVVLAVLIGTSIALSLSVPAPPPGFVEADLVSVSENRVIIGSNCTAIVAETSPERAYNIFLGLQGVIPVRPTTHDTIVQILRSFNITVEKLTLDSFDGRYYYSSLYLRRGEKLLKLDVMPSDGIAVAVRTGAPIFVNSTLLKEMGSQLC